MRMHVVIIAFSAVHAARRESFAVFAVIYALYFFPWRLLRRNRVADAKLRRSPLRPRLERITSPRAPRQKSGARPSETVPRSEGRADTSRVADEGGRVLRRKSGVPSDRCLTEPGRPRRFRIAVRALLFAATPTAAQRRASARRASAEAPAPTSIRHDRRRRRAVRRTGGRAVRNRRACDADEWTVLLSRDVSLVRRASGPRSAAVAVRARRPATSATGYIRASCSRS